jgi:hypothetical protein
MDIIEAIKGRADSLVVIDDALAPPNFALISAEALTAQFRSLDANADHCTILAAQLGLNEDATPAELMEAVSRDASRLWPEYLDGTAKIPLDPLFEEFKLKHAASKLKEQLLVEFLERQFSVRPKVFSSLADAKEALKSCVVAFVDFYIGDVNSEDDAIEAHSQFREELASRFEFDGSPWPKLVFLISSKLPSQHGLNSFRERTGMRSAFFSALDKKDISDDFLTRYVDRIVGRYGEAAQLDGYLRTIEKSICRAAESLSAEVARLELHDLTTLKSLRLDAESESLQGYLTWLLSEALAVKLRSDSELQGSLLPGEARYTPLDGKLLPGSVLFELFSEIAVAPIPNADLAAHVTMGDVFEITSGAGKGEVILVVAPACDLMRCATLYEVLCVRGTIDSQGLELPALIAKKYAFGKGHIVIRSVEGGKPLYRCVRWDHKRLTTIRHGDLAGTSYKRIARMSEIFVQEVKELALSQVARIGTPIDPSFSVAVQLAVRLRIATGKDTPEISFFADLSDREFVQAVLAMGRSAPTGVDGSTEPGDLQKTIVFSYQFQEWIVGELNNLSLANGTKNEKLTRIITFFSDPTFSKIELKPSGTTTELGGLISFSLKDTPPDTDQAKAGIEVIAFPMQIPAAPGIEVKKEQLH